MNLRHWSGKTGEGTPEPPLPRALRGDDTEWSTTVFSGQAPAWSAYLQSSHDQRYEGTRIVDIRCELENRRLSFAPRNQASGLLSDCLGHGYRLLCDHLSPRPWARDQLFRLLFENGSNERTPLVLRVSASLPSEGSREVRLNDRLQPLESNIVLRQSMVDPVLAAFGDGSPPGSREREDELGSLLPILATVISQLGLRSYPRDRYL